MDTSQANFREFLRTSHQKCNIFRGQYCADTKQEISRKLRNGWVEVGTHSGGCVRSAMYLSCAISPWWISPTHEAGRSGLWMKGWGHSGRNEVPPRRGWVQPFWMRSSDIRRESEVEPLLPGVWGSKLSWFAYLIWMPERCLPPVVYWVHPSGWMTKNHWCTDASWSSWSPCKEERER